MTKHIHIHLPALLRKSVADRKVKDRSGSEIRTEIAKVEAEMKKTKNDGLLADLASELKRLRKELSVVKDAGGVESLSANDISEKYGFTFLAKVKKDGSAKAPDGKTIRTDGGRFTSTDAFFTKHDPREYNRLTDEIKEIEAKIKATKAPFQKQDLERVKAKLVAERSKYRTDDASGAASVEKEIAQLQRLMDALVAHDKPIPGAHHQKMAFLKDELAKAKAQTADAEPARTEKTYTSPPLARAGIVEMRSQGWKVASEVRNPEGTITVAFVK